MALALALSCTVKNGQTNFKKLALSIPQNFKSMSGHLLALWMRGLKAKHLNTYTKRRPAVATDQRKWYIINLFKTSILLIFSL